MTVCLCFPQVSKTRGDGQAWHLICFDACLSILQQERVFKFGRRPVMSCVTDTDSLHTLFTRSASVPRARPFDQIFLSINITVFNTLEHSSDKRRLQYHGRLVAEASTIFRSISVRAAYCTLLVESWAEYLIALAVAEPVLGTIPLIAFGQQVACWCSSGSQCSKQTNGYPGQQ